MPYFTKKFKVERPSIRKAYRPKRRSYATRAPMAASSYVGNQGYFRLGSSLSRRVLKTQERNFVDTTLSSLAVDTTGSVTLINVIPQGVTVNQRIGKKALLKSVQIRGSFTPNSVANINKCALMLVYDSQSNGAAIPAVTDILTAATSNVFTNNDNTHRFTILRRYDCLLQSSITVGVGVSELPSAIVEDFIKLDKEIEWNISAATGVQATIQKGALYVVTVGSNTAGTAAAIFSGNTRVRFTEEY